MTTEISELIPGGPLMPGYAVLGLKFYQKYLLTQLLNMTTIIFQANPYQHRNSRRSILLRKMAMRIILCLDYSAFTEKVLASMQDIVQSIKDCKITVIHIIDETLFAAGTGFEVEFNEDIKKDSARLKQLSIQYLGKHVQYIEEYGIPRNKIDQILAGSDYDLLAIGNHSKSMLGTPRIGGIAEHLLVNSTVPVIVIP